MNMTDPIYHDDEAARAHLEAQRWPNGPYCPHCGEAENIARLEGAAAAKGLFNCRSCRTKFSVTVGTVFESSHIGLAKWLLAFRLMASSKKGISALQLQRSLDLKSYRSAWFMAHRIREAMAGPANPSALGGEGKVIEADATYVGGKKKNKHAWKRQAGNIGGKGKMIVHTLVERGGGSRSQHVANVNGDTLRPIIVKHASRKSAFMTDTAGGYHHIGKEFARHEMVDHGKDEYARGDAYSNTAESFFAIFKRGVYGTFHSVSEAHIHRYLTEFDFRWSNRSALGVDDTTRTNESPEGSTGKRLTYRRTSQGAHA